jgi:hypothetical protein
MFLQNFRLKISLKVSGLVVADAEEAEKAEAEEEVVPELVMVEKDEVPELVNGTLFVLLAHDPLPRALPRALRLFLIILH